VRREQLVPAEGRPMLLTQESPDTEVGKERRFIVVPSQICPAELAHQHFTVASFRRTHVLSPQAPTLTAQVRFLTATGEFLC